MRLQFRFAYLSPVSAKAADDEGTAAPKDLTNTTLVYAGTFTTGKSKGIYLFRLQTQNLEVSQNIMLVPLGLAAETTSPAFLEIDNKRNLLFAVNETNTFEGKPTGGVSSFKIGPSDRQADIAQPEIVAWHGAMPSGAR